MSRSQKHVWIESAVLIELKVNEEALNDDGKALKGIGVTLEGDVEALKGNG